MNGRKEELMRIGIAVVCVAASMAGCKKSGTGTGGGGGGGGGWLVGSSAMMVNLGPDGTTSGYDTGTTARLTGIACRNEGEAWVVGEAGTVLYTSDAGQTWRTQQVPTTALLNSLATQDDGPVFLAGNGTFLESDDVGATWRELGDGHTNFLSVAAATDADLVLAVSDDGTVWSHDGAQLAPRIQLVGARAVAVSTDGQTAIVAGTGLWKSNDRGVTWQALQTANLAFEDVRLAGDDSAIAVGAGGAIAMIDPSGHVIAQHVGTSDLHAVRVGGTGWGDAISYAAGEDGQVYESRDAGWTWTKGAAVGGAVYGIDEIGLGHR
jgi:photosystem II stability/assembly factor-like uncharacterized protein